MSWKPLKLQQAVKAEQLIFRFPQEAKRNGLEDVVIFGDFS